MCYIPPFLTYAQPNFNLQMFLFHNYMIEYEWEKRLLLATKT